MPSDKVKVKRRYTVIDYPTKGETFGEFTTTSSPKAAASKAFTKMARNMKLKNTNKKNALVYTIRDLDSGKEHKYSGVRVELEEPIVQTIAGRKVEYKFKNIITKLKD